MKNTILFLLFLIVPIAFGNPEVLSLIDRTPEGKELIDHLFLQMKIMGSQFDSATYNAFFKSVRETVEDEYKKTVDLWEPMQKQCVEDKKILKQLLMEHTDKEFSIQRHLDTVKRTKERKRVELDRSREEYDNYNKFAGFIAENQKKAAEHYKMELDNLAAVKELLQKIKDIIKGEASRASTSFVQLTSQHYTIFTEIKNSISELINDSTGLSPIISNLVEVLQDPTANMKPEVQVAIRGIVNSLLETIRDRRDEAEEQQEYTNTLFDRLGKTFDANLERGKKVLVHLETVISQLDEQITVITAELSHKRGLRTQVRGIFEARMKECKAFDVQKLARDLKAEKIQAMIGELEQLVQRQEKGFEAFFIQRSMRQNIK